jgi:hypothetical protein
LRPAKRSDHIEASTQKDFAMRRLLIGLVIFAGFWLYNGGFDQLTGATSSANGDPVQEFNDDDAQMNTAMDIARSTLPAFLANQTDDSGAAVGNTSVKVAFDVGGHTAAALNAMLSPDPVPPSWN